MKKLIVVTGLFALVTPAMADEYYIVQNPTTRHCTIVEKRPEPSAGLVIGIPFGVRVEAESRMKTVKECTESTTTGSGVRIEERREERR
jgi:hypothetical protein